MRAGGREGGSGSAGTPRRKQTAKGATQPTLVAVRLDRGSLVRPVVHLLGRAAAAAGRRVQLNASLVCRPLEAQPRPGRREDGDGLEVRRRADDSRGRNLISAELRGGARGQGAGRAPGRGVGADVVGQRVGVQQLGVERRRLARHVVGRVEQVKVVVSDGRVALADRLARPVVVRGPVQRRRQRPRRQRRLGVEREDVGGLVAGAKRGARDKGVPVSVSDSRTVGERATYLQGQAVVADVLDAVRRVQIEAPVLRLKDKGQRCWLSRSRSTDAEEALASARGNAPASG